MGSLQNLGIQSTLSQKQLFQTFCEAQHSIYTILYLRRIATNVAFMLCIGICYLLFPSTLLRLFVADFNYCILLHLQDATTSILERDSKEN